MAAFPACRSTAREQLRSISAASVSSNDKCLLKRKEPPDGGPLVSNVVNQDQLVVDNDLGAVMVDIPIMIAILDDDRVVIAGNVAVVNHFAFPNHIAVAMLADRHAGTDRTHTYANAHFFGKCRQRSSDHRSGRDRSYI
jgi:hypothetical protein